MSLFGKLVISLIVAAVAAAIAANIGSHGQFPVLFGAFAAATVVTSLLGSIKAPANTAPASAAADKNSPNPPKKPARGPTRNAGGKGARESGTVKWFNVSKGFGFVTRESGEEIFVHFRSIRGEGRRSLRDGQSVTFVVADSEKGLQAEDVEAAD